MLPPLFRYGMKMLEEADILDEISEEEEQEDEEEEEDEEEKEESGRKELIDGKIQELPEAEKENKGPRQMMA